MSEQLTYYPYWDRVILEARIIAWILVLELGAIAVGIWRR